MPHQQKTTINKNKSTAKNGKASKNRISDQYYTTFERINCPFLLESPWLGKILRWMVRWQQNPKFHYILRRLYFVELYYARLYFAIIHVLITKIHDWFFFYGSCMVFLWYFCSSMLFFLVFYGIFSISNIYKFKPNIPIV